MAQLGNVMFLLEKKLIKSESKEPSPPPRAVSSVAFRPWLRTIFRSFQCALCDQPKSTKAPAIRSPCSSSRRISVFLCACFGQGSQKINHAEIRSLSRLDLLLQLFLEVQGTLTASSSCFLCSLSAISRLCSSFWRIVVRRCASISCRRAFSSSCQKRQIYAKCAPS